MLERLARELNEKPELRAEAVAIHQRQGKQGPRPSDTYIAWKHELNQLAKVKRVDPALMLEAVIETAIRRNRESVKREKKLRRQQRRRVT